MPESKRPRVVQLGNAEQGIALSGKHAGAVAPADPALDDLELLGDARVVGHEHDSARFARLIRVPGPV